MHPKDYLPLTETSFFILLSIAVTPKHGYAIIQEVESMSAGRVSLATGTLYTALADQVPPQFTSPFIELAKTKMSEVITSCAQYYREHGFLSFRFQPPQRVTRYIPRTQ